MMRRKKPTKPAKRSHRDDPALMSVWPLRISVMVAVLLLVSYFLTNEKLIALPLIFILPVVFALSLRK